MARKDTAAPEDADPDPVLSRRDRELLNGVLLAMHAVGYREYARLVVYKVFLLYNEARRCEEILRELICSQRKNRDVLDGISRTMRAVKGDRGTQLVIAKMFTSIQEAERCKEILGKIISKALGAHLS